MFSYLYFSLHFSEGAGGGPLQGAKGQTPDGQRQQFHRQGPAHCPRCIAFGAGHTNSQLPAFV